MSILKAAQCHISKQLAHKSSNAFISLLDETSVLARARTADTERDSNDSTVLGRLIAVKDNICTTEFRTTCASNILRNFRSPYDATVVERLHQHGAIVVGKTNMDEFGMGSHSIHSAFGPVVQRRGPYGLATSAGGSSGGSAVAVATEQCWAALGTDTGGSVRLPAAYTGIVGFKPSYGLVSRWGVVAYANSLDTVGILARSVDDVRNMFDVVEGYDAKDPTSLTQSMRDRIRSQLARTSSPKTYRIGIPMEYNVKELSVTVRDAWLKVIRTLGQNGNPVSIVSLPTTRHALSTYYVLAPAEASSNLAKYDGVRYGTRAPGPDNANGVLFSRTREEGFGSEVKRRILLGAYTLSAGAIDNYFIQAQKVRRLVQQDFDRVFASPNLLVDKRPEVVEDDGRVDVLLCPTAPTLPPAIEQLHNQNPVQEYVNDVFTVPASLAGLPSLSVPVHLDKGLGFETPEGPPASVGLQIIGQYGDDDAVLQVGRLVEDLMAS